MSLQYNPTSSFAVVELFEMFNEDNKCALLLNPQSLTFHMKARTARLDPVGWSHQILQGAGSESMTLPLEFFLSAEFFRRIGSQFSDIRKAAQWFGYFLYGRAPGIERAPMLIIWPGVITMAYVVETLDVSYTRFNRYIEPVEGKINLTGTELRQGFRTGSMVLQNGWSDFTAPEATRGSSAFRPGSGTSGPSLNLSGPKGSKK